MSPNIFVWGLKPRPLGRHFWHKEMQSISCARNPYGISLYPKDPLSKENSVKPAPLGAGRSFLWIFMINVRIFHPVSDWWCEFTHRAWKILSMLKNHIILVSNATSMPPIYDGWFLTQILLSATKLQKI